jgi:serine/threonine protein kinase
MANTTKAATPEGNPMNACPPLEKLELLLADKLGGADRDAVEAHVETCSSCQQQLDSCSPTPSLLQSAVIAVMPSDDNSDAALQPNERFVQRLRQIRIDSATVQANVAPVIGAEWLSNRRLGPYEFIRQLGKGGMGAVYLARHVELGKIVAVKVLPAEQLNELTIARFKREIRSIGQLDHPNIVTAHDAGEHGGVHFLVMSLVDGVDLRRIVERRGKLPIADACEAARQAALGLQHAVDRGLVHRDVKPSNLMITRDGLVKLVDLGLSRSVGDAGPDTLTAAGTLLGTADYLAPEQWDNPQTADTRADIYGLGCSLFHLLTGQPPFAAEEFKSVMAKMRAHHETPLPAVTRWSPDAPAELVTVVKRMVAKKPADRFASPAEVATALRPFAKGANLVQLVRENSRPEDGMIVEPVEAAATSGAGMWETDANSIRRAPAPVARKRSRDRIAIAAACLLLFGGAFAWLAYHESPTKPTPPVTIADLSVVHYRDKGNQLIGDLEKSSAKVVELDDVRVSAHLSAPGYAYLIAFNPRGAKEVEQLCYPEDELGGVGAPTIRPEPKTQIQYPRATYIFQVEPIGLQAFVLAASSKPLPPYQEWRANAGKIPWPTDKVEIGFGRWFFDGKSFARIPRDRGRVETKEYIPESFEKLCRFFRSRPEFDSVQAIAFSVSSDQK